MTIPSSQIVSTTPSVLAAGGGTVATVGMLLTSNTRVPIGTVATFTSELAVQNYFGAGANPVTLAGIYFPAWEGATQTPGEIKFTQYNQIPVAAYLRGGNISSLTLAQLQALSGTLTVVFDGYSRSGGTISLTAATSFTSAASIIETALNASLPAESSVTASIAAETSTFTASIAGYVMTVTSAPSNPICVGGTLSGTGVTSCTVTEQFTGTAGGIGTYGVSVAQTVSSETLTESYGLMTVTAVLSGTVSVGQTLSGTGVTSGSLVTQLGTGTGSDGTYYVNDSQTVGSETITGSATAVVVSYDSVSGAFVVTSGVLGAASSAAFATGTLAASIMLTQATGAVLSQGAAPAVPAAFMSNLIQVDNDWVIFMTDFDPDQGSGSTQKQAFAAWKNTQNNRFAYACEDSDPTAKNTVPATSSLGYILTNNGDSGTSLNWQSTINGELAAFVCGVTAAINFQQAQGRITYAFKAQAGFTAGVSDPTSALNLAGNPQTVGSRGNGYNFYGVYANAGQSNVWYQRGFVTGPYGFLDSYIDQIWLTNICQNALLGAFGSFNSIPFTAASILEQVLIGTPDNPGPILQALTFGAFGPGSISSSQAANLNNAVGPNAANTLQSQGWVLQIVAASATVRASRGPQQINLWYLDNGVVQSISLATIAVIP